MENDLALLLSFLLASFLAVAVSLFSLRPLYLFLFVLSLCFSQIVHNIKEIAENAKAPPMRLR